MYIRDIMTKKPVTVAQGDAIAEAAKLMRASDIGCLIVTNAGKPVGVITDRDIVVGCTCEGHDCNECAVEGHMSSPAVTAPAGMDVLEAAHLMTQKKVKRLPVVEGGKLVGLVSFSDIAQAMERPMHDLLLGMGAARRVA